MKTILLLSLTVYFGLFSILSSQGQQNQTPVFDFKNAPVLFKERGKSYQQVAVFCNAPDTASVLFTSNGKKLLRASLQKGTNRFLLTFPAVSVPREISIITKIRNTPEIKTQFTLVPPKKWEIYLVQHTHTDIGYTRPQSEILAEHMRYIDYALDYCDQTDNMPDEAKFRWTCESSWVVREYLRSRSSGQVERLKKRIAEGRIEVTGMFANMAEIADENLLYDFLKPLREISEHDIPVKTVLQNDVNGIAWCMPDYFKNTGVKFLVMGINKTRSILPFDMPTCFWWESPSGQRLLAFRADHYHTGNNFGVVSKAISPERMLWHLADLDSRHYPFDKISIQFSGYHTDNSPPSTIACELVKQWNQQYEYPKLRLATSSEFMEYVEKNHAENLPVYRNAWLDWWTDGVGSQSRETAEIRKFKI